MKLGICDVLHHSAHANLGEHKYAALKALGFDAIDYSLSNVDDAFYTAPMTDVRSLVSDIRAQIEGADMFVSQVHGPWTWPPIYDADADARAVRLEQMKRAVELAALLGSPYLVIHPLMPFACRDVLLHKEQEAHDINAQFMRALLPHAREHGITVCLENMPMKALALASPSAILRFVKEIDDPFFKICLDTGHTTMVSDGSVADTVYMLRDELRVLHVHDNGGEHDEHRLPGEGIIDWQAFVKALHGISFDGVFSLEAVPPKSPL